MTREEFELAESNEISAAIWCHYMDHETAATVKDIAAGCKRSESWARKRLSELERGRWGVPGCDYAKRYVNVIERNYNTVRCQRAVEAYVPTRAWIAAKYKALVKWPDKKEVE